MSRHLFDFLASEVLDEMPEALHGFLLRTSVLPELPAAHVAAVSGDARAAVWLAEIERRRCAAPLGRAAEGEPARRCVDNGRAIAVRAPRRRAEALGRRRAVHEPAATRRMDGRDAPCGGAAVARRPYAAALRTTRRRGGRRAGTVRSGRAGDDGLSARGREALACIAAGDSNKHIARALDISPHTVKRHVANILDKLGLASCGQDAAWLRGHRAVR